MRINFNTSKTFIDLFCVGNIIYSLFNLSLNIINMFMFYYIVIDLMNKKNVQFDCSQSLKII